MVLIYSYIISTMSFQKYVFRRKEEMETYLKCLIEFRIMVFRLQKKKKGAAHLY